MASNIQIETDKDRIVNTPTIPGLKVNMDNIEVSMDDSNKKPLVEIPERISSVRRPSFGSKSEDSSSDKEAGNFKFLINPKKFNPIPKEPLESEDQRSGKQRDTDSEKSKKSNRSVHTRFSSNSNKKDTSDADEYRPRYGSFGSSFKTQSGTPAAATVPNVGIGIGSLFGGRKSHENLSEDDLRKMKSHYLEQYERKNQDFKYSPKKLSMKNDLEEIRSELEYINTKRQKEVNMDNWKKGLLLFSHGVVVANDWAKDPFDVDLSNWPKEMYWDLNRAGKYDEVIEELVEKYHQGRVPIPPEWKLLFMMGTSLVLGVMTKKQEQAQMKKRMAEDRIMAEKVRNQVRQEVARMQFVPQHQQQQQQTQRPVSIGQHRNRINVPRPASPGNKMSGPSLSDAEIMKLMEANFIDSTIAADGTSVASSETKASKRSSASKRSQQRDEEERQDQQQPRKRGRPRKHPLPTEFPMADIIGSDIPEMDTSDKVIRLPAANAAVTPKRGRGRPRKNALHENNVITLERL